MTSITTIRITRIEAAQRQLETALELWFAGGEPVSIHSLAARAHQLVHDLNRKSNGPELLFDSSVIKQESKKKIVAMMKECQNFFKHADFRKGNKGDAIEFDPTTLSETFFLMTIKGMGYLGYVPTPLHTAFMAWATVHRSEWLSDSVQVIHNSIPVEVIDGIRAYSRSDFLDAFNKQRIR